MNQRKPMKLVSSTVLIGLYCAAVITFVQYHTSIKQYREAMDVVAQVPSVSNNSIPASDAATTGGSASRRTSSRHERDDISGGWNSAVSFEPPSSRAPTQPPVSTTSNRYSTKKPKAGSADVTSDSLQTQAISDTLTIVTAYFDIGSFTKGPWQIPRSPGDYLIWLTTFQGLHSPVIAYFDSQANVKMFTDLRRGLPANLTIVRKVDREQLRTFDLRPKIAHIFNTSGYKRHYPNTVIADFATVVNAKYELLRLVVLENPFRTRYFSWMDAGYFREFVYAPWNARFSVCLPPNFRSDSVAYQEVIKINKTLTAADIIRGNFDWIAGGFFVAESNAMLRWTDEYLTYSRQLIVDHHLAGADQQIIYAIVNTFNVSTLIQTYVDDGVSGNVWFQLGYRARNACDVTHSSAQNG